MFNKIQEEDNLEIIYLLYYFFNNIKNYSLYLKSIIDLKYK